MKVLDEFAKKKQRLEMIQKQKELDEFMLAVDKMKQKEKNLYKPPELQNVNSLHRSNLSDQNLPQDRRINCDKFNT